jgi:lipoate-protein ligase A
MRDYPLSTWRLILSPPANGPWNMAVDEAILEAIEQQSAPPTLRLYGWQPACLSLGYAQPIAEVSRPALQAHGWQLVRRPTGGRAILHVDELTYAVIAPNDEPRLAGSLLDSYRRLSQAILNALHHLGIPAEASSQPQEIALDSPGDTAQPSKGPVCFEVPSNYEITVANKKLVGSAQARRKRGVLQHGSFPLYGDLTRITQVLHFPDESRRQRAARRLLERATTAENVLGQPLDWQQAAQAFVTGFEDTLHLQFQPGDLSSAESQRAGELERVKYRHPDWTAKI